MRHRRIVHLILLKCHRNRLTPSSGGRENVRKDNAISIKATTKDKQKL
jgi:hypothetical protein